MQSTSVQASWNPLSDLQLLWQYHFMHNAFLAGGVVAVVAGIVGYYVVLREQTFAAHALAQIGFAGAAGALVVGASPITGLLVVGLATAVGMGLLDVRDHVAQADDGVTVAAILTFGLGVGLLFLQLYAGQAENAYAILFGAVLGVSDNDVLSITITAVVALLAMAIIGRPLLFASIDPDVAGARGVPVRALSVGFLIVVALAVAQAVQVVGVLLIFALLVTPAAIAQRLTARPATALWVSVLLSLLFTWGGLAIAYFAPYSVVGFYVTSLAFGTYTVVRVAQLGMSTWTRRRSAVHGQLVA